MKPVLALIATATLLSGCVGANFVDSDVERGLVGAAVGYGVAEAIDGNQDRGAIIGGLAGVFCDDAGFCRRAR